MDALTVHWIFYKANCFSKDKTMHSILNIAFVRSYIKRYIHGDRVKVEILVLKNNHMRLDDMSGERSTMS